MIALKLILFYVDLIEATVETKHYVYFSELALKYDLWVLYCQALLFYKMEHS